MKILLDTNAYSALARGHEALVARAKRAEEIVLSAIVAGELMFGFRNGNRHERNAADLEVFLQNPHVRLVPVTLVTAERFGRIAALLRRNGRPIPTNDIWIAAHALETGAELLSFDPHFDAVDGLAFTRL